MKCYQEKNPVRMKDAYSYCCLVAKLHPTLLQPMDYSLPGLLFVGFPRQEYWSGLPFPLSGDLPNPGIKPLSPTLAGGFFTTEPPGKPTHAVCVCESLSRV